MEEDSPREETVDAEAILHSVHYKAMRRLMALVDIHSCKTAEEYQDLADLFPAILNSFPEYHSITQAYVQSFSDGNEDRKLKKRKTLPSLTIIKGNPFKAVVAKVKKSAGKDKLLIKMRAAKVVPILIHLPKWKEGGFLNRASERLARTFCVETQGDARLRRLKQRFSEMNVRKIKAAKIIPMMLNIDEVRKDHDLIAGKLARLAALFCVETKEEARVRRRKYIRNGKRMENLIRNKDEMLHDDYADEFSDGFDAYFSLSEISVTENLAQNIRELDLDQEKKNGKLSRYLKSVRKMFNKKEN